MKLSDLNGLVRKVITEALPDKLWVIGEISEMKTNRNGHCYLVLVEKDVSTDTVIAQARATIWSYTFRMLRPYFETTTGQVFIEGLKVLVSVSVEFHELYGYNLNIHDIDPTYTLGDMARRRREIITRLTEEGIVDMNKELEFPYVPQKIAVISSETAAGYQDFTDHLTKNKAGYVFYLKLFPAVMQGNQTEASIIEALDQIYLYEDFFDVVVIIRGGGSQLDLSCFDNYNLACHITQFPLPVITGIGHEKDNTIVDIVAHTRLKTPTAVAEFLIDEVSKFDLLLEDTKGKFLDSVQELLLKSNNMIEHLARKYGPVIHGKINRSIQNLNQKVWQVDHLVKSLVADRKYELARKEENIRRNTQQHISLKYNKLEIIAGLLSSGLRIIIPVKLNHLNNSLSAVGHSARKRLADENHRLDLASQKVYLTDPARVLARGYSVTTHNGIIIKDISQVLTDDIIMTTLYKGVITSTVLDKEDVSTSCGREKS